MKTPTIRALGISVIAATLITGVIYVSSAYMIRNEIQDSRSIWNNYQRISANRAQSLSSIIHNLGYGGMIHSFKDFIIKGEEDLAQRATLSAGAALAAIERYKASPISASEQTALASIQTNIMAYMKAITAATEALMEGETVSGIDKLIKINDTPALKSIETLRQAINGTNSSSKSNTKTDQYGQMLSALGYGGMIHNFTNYIIRGDKPRIAKIKKAINSYRQAAKSYRALGINVRESKALAAIDKAVSIYEKDLVIAIDLRNGGMLPADISHRFKPDFEPLMQGLKTLNGAIEQQIMVSKNELTKNLKTASAFSVTVLWLALFATIAMMFLNSTIIFTRIVAPIRNIKTTMFALAGGDMDVKIKYTGRQDEIGSMARAIEVFQKNALEITRLEQDKLRLEEMAVQKRKKTMFALSNSFEQSIGAVVTTTREAVSALEQTAITMHENASMAVEQADNVNSAAEESAASVTVVASASQELDASITGIQEEVEQSREMANMALAESEKSKDTMQDLVARTEKISSIVEMINDIAGQTNLLALNATIEASRAGEAGRGFAVVASEVKTLADQTSKATEEIGNQIGALQKISSLAAANMNEIDTVISRMNEFSTSVAGAITQQSAATNEIAQNIDMAASGTNEVTQGISMVKKSADDSGVTATSLQNHAKNLSEQTVLLDEKVASFVGTIRTAWH